MGLLYLLIVILFFYLILVYHLTAKDIFCPPAIMILVFILSINFACLNGINWNINYSIKSFALLAIGILSFIVPYIYLYRIWSKTNSKFVVTENHFILIDNWKILSIILIDFIILFIYRNSVIKLVINAGYSGANIQWAFRNMTSYEGTESLSTSIRILTKFLDVSAYIFVFIFINNVIIYKYKSFKQFLYLIPAVLFCIKTLLSGGRQDLLRLIGFSFVCIYFQNRCKEGWKKNLSTKYVIRGILLMTAVLPGFYYALKLTGRKSTRTLFTTLSTYVGGPIQHFDQYVCNPINKSPFFGNETLTPILNMLGKVGIIEYSNTVHLEFRQLHETIGNVYTFFRRPLQDFGIIGMLIFTISVSIFFSIYYLWFVRNKVNNLHNNIVTIIYAYLLYWIELSSIEQYSMTIISAHTLLTIIIFVVFWRLLFCVHINPQKQTIKIKTWKKMSGVI